MFGLELLSTCMSRTPLQRILIGFATAGNGLESKMQGNSIQKSALVIQNSRRHRLGVDEPRGDCAAQSGFEPIQLNVSVFPKMEFQKSLFKFPEQSEKGKSTGSRSMLLMMP